MANLYSIQVGLENLDLSFETVSLRERRQIFKTLEIPTIAHLHGAHGVTRSTFHPFDLLGKMPLRRSRPRFQTAASTVAIFTRDEIGC